jgi:hypothetical protein
MREDRLALGILALAGVLIFAAPLARREVFTFRDHAVYFVPLRYFTADVMREGRLPLWNPYNASGEPWLANPQTAVLYPPQWLFLLLPFETAYVAYLMLHVIFLGGTSYLLFRRNASAGAAMVGALAMMACGPTLSLLDVGTILTTLAWLPLVFWLGASRADRTARPIAVDAAVLALTFLAGEPFFAAFAAACYASIVIAARRDGRSALEVIGVGAGAAAIAAVQILPFLEWLRGTNRGIVMTGASAASHAMPLENWLRLVIPPRVSAEGDPLLLPQFIPMMYAGVVVVAAALVGMVVSRKRVAIGWALLILVAAFFSAGLAGGAPIRYPLRMIPIGMIGVAGFAVAGWDRFRPRRFWVDCLVALVIAGDVVPRAVPLLRTLPLSSLRVPLGNVGHDGKILRIPLERSAMADPLAWLYGYQNLYDRRFDTGSASPAVPMRYAEMFHLALSGQRMDLVNQMSARYLFSDRRLPLPVVARVRDVLIHDNRGARPMASPASSWRININSARIDVDRPQPGPVTLTQRDGPGWSVWVDGVRRTKRAGNDLFLAVEVPAGRHAIVWRYLPLSVIGGGAVSLAGLVWLFVSLLQRRRKVGDEIVRALEPDRGAQ